MPQDTPFQDRPPPEWRTDVIETGDFALTEMEAGEGQPVFCLGFQDPQASRLLDDLAQRFRLIALMPAAAPLSQAPDLDAHALARETLACADRLGVERFMLLARNDEDHAALCLALISPERVEAIALLAPDLHSRDGAVEDAELLERLCEVKTPLLAVFGGLDRFITPQTARVWRERLPACRIVFVPDAGREVDLERPHATGRLAAEFLLRPKPEAAGA